MQFMENFQKAKTRKFNMAVDTESRYNLMIFSTFAKRDIMRLKQDYRSNIRYENALSNFYLGHPKQTLP